jgi:hypothetical protein
MSNISNLNTLQQSGTAKMQTPFLKIHIGHGTSLTPIYLSLVRIPSLRVRVNATVTKAWEESRTTDIMHIQERPKSSESQVTYTISSQSKENNESVSKYSASALGGILRQHKRTYPNQPSTSLLPILIQPLGEKLADCATPYQRKRDKRRAYWNLNNATHAKQPMATNVPVTSGLLAKVLNESLDLDICSALTPCTALVSTSTCFSFIVLGA